MLLRPFWRLPHLPLLPRPYGDILMGPFLPFPSHSLAFRSILPFRWEILWFVDCFEGFSFGAPCRLCLPCPYIPEHQELKPWRHSISQLSKKRKLPVSPLLCRKDTNMPAGAGSNALANWLHSMSCFPGRRSLGQIWGLESEPTPLGSCQGGPLQRFCQSMPEWFIWVDGIWWNCVPFKFAPRNDL